MGPEALRVARLGERLARRGMHVVDRGNVAGPLNPWLPPTDGYRHLPEATAWNTSVHDAVYAELTAGNPHLRMAEPSHQLHDCLGMSISR